MTRQFVNVNLLLILFACTVMPICATTYYVDAAKNGDGSSWTNAEDKIQDAIDRASSGDSVWVKAVVNGNYNEHIVLKAGVSVYGGFPSSGDPAWNDRNPATNVTIIDATNKDNSVVTAGSGITTATVIDGFTIQKGAGRLYSTSRYGGGIECNGGSPTISHNIIQNNTATYGGGIKTATGTSPIIEYNTIQNNKADYGAGVHMYNGTCRYNTITLNTNLSTGSSCGGGICIGSYADQVTISDNTITYNETITTGGGIYTTYSPAVVSGNTISENTVSMTTGAGGGIYAAAGSPIIDDNPSIDNNHAWSGGGIYVWSTSATISDNLVTENDAVAGSSGIVAAGGSLSPIVTRNTITDNHISTSGTGGGGGVGCWTNSAVISFNTIEGNSAPAGGGAINCWNFSGIINNNVMKSNSAANGGAMNFSESAPSVYCNLVAANSATTYGGGIYWYSTKTGSQGSIINNTFAANICTNGGGIYLYTTSPTITNNIIVSNTSGIAKSTNDAPVVTYNDVWNNTNYNYSWTTPANNISQDPLLDTNYRIPVNSPCVDTGYDSAVTAGWLDIYNQPRQVDIPNVGTTDVKVDIGADEYYPDYSNSPMVDKGIDSIPSANINNGSDRYNIRWADSTSPAKGYGDDFSIAYTGPSWVIDKISVWVVPDVQVSPSVLPSETYILGKYFQSVSLYGGIKDNSLTIIDDADLSTTSNSTSNANITITPEDYRVVNFPGDNSYTVDSTTYVKYEAADGLYHQMWRIDFNNPGWTISAGTEYSFGVLGVPQVDRLWFNHASYASGGEVRPFDTITFSTSSLVSGAGWFGKGSDINVKVYAHPQ